MTETTQRYARLYKARGGCWELHIALDAANRMVVAIIEVAGKRDARKRAAEENAICYNF